MRIHQRVGVFVTTLAIALGVGAVIATPAHATVLGPYRFRVPGYNYCLDVRGASYDNGALLQVYTCLPNQTNQQFYIYLTDPPNQWEIRPVHTGKCLDVVAASPNYGANVQQYTCLGSAQLNQQWYIGSQQYHPQNRLPLAQHSGWCLGVVSWLSNGVDVKQDWCGENPWLIEPV